jgi:hypothetical protein
MFAPGHSTIEREHKVEIGLTALLTMSIVMLSLSDMIPKTPTSMFPFLGRNDFPFFFFFLYERRMQYPLQANGVPTR